MGSAIQYCIFCQDQIPQKDIEAGKAVQREGGLICPGCATKAGIPAAAPPPSRPTPPPPPRRNPKGETSKILPGQLKAHAARVPSKPSAKSPLPMVYAGLGLVVLVLVFVLATRNNSTPAPSAPTAPIAGSPPSDPKPDPAKAAEELRRRERDAAAQKAFDDIKSQADADEKGGSFDFAISEWDQFPKDLLEGKWAEKVADEKKRLRGAKADLEREASDASPRSLHAAAALADQQKYTEAIAELDKFLDKYKRTDAAAEVNKARSRYDDARRALPTPPVNAQAGPDEQCFNAMSNGNHAAARQVWQGLLNDPQQGAMAKVQIDRIAAFEKALQDDGVAEWPWKNHMVVEPKGGERWTGESQGNILVYKNAELDGTKVVLIGIDGKMADAGWVVCISLAKKSLWKFDTSAQHWPNAPKEMNAAAIEVADLLGDGKREILTVSNSVGMFPCRVCVLGSDGRLKSEYWNPGQGGKPFVCELDGDNKPEVLLSFVNNDLGMTPTLFCFRGSDISGEGPPNGKGSWVWYVKVPDAQLPLGEVSFVRKKDNGPVERILCKYQNGTWAVGADGKLIGRQ